MNKEMIVNQIEEYVINSGCDFFDTPLVGFSAADDLLYQKLKEPNAIGPHFMLPNEWLAEAKTVISIFLPFTQKIRQSNQQDFDWPSEEWLYGRIEGQAFIYTVIEYLQKELTNAGFESVIPPMDARSQVKVGSGVYTSNWSERHVAFVCGLGTFGLSGGLITQKGMAGRFCSLVTNAELAPTKRAYTELYEYCTRCGKCAQNCPVHAISLAQGKDHRPCSDFLDLTKEKSAPRYGCGKCQVGVPCEHGIPTK